MGRRWWIICLAAVLLMTAVPAVTPVAVVIDVSATAVDGETEAAVLSAADAVSGAEPDSAIAADSDAALEPEAAFAPDRVIVKLKNSMFRTRGVPAAENGMFYGVEVERVESLVPAPSAAKTYAASASAASADAAGLYLLTLRAPGREQVREAVRILESRAEVAYAEPDYMLYAEDVVPDDPEFNRQYGLASIGAPQTWEMQTGSGETVVAVLDTGIDLTHPDLVNNLWVNSGEIAGNGVDDDMNGYVDDVYGWNFVSDTADVSDDHGHGTHVSGIIGASGNNGVGVAGVCWDVSIMPLKVLGADGGGYNSNFIQALSYVKSMGVPLTNNSYGGGGYSQALQEAIASCGALFVAAAGNERMDNDLYPHYPSDYDCENILSVGATGSDDRIAFFSNIGKHSVDLFAPGVGIYSCAVGGGYVSMSGTSMATPFASGAAALLLSSEPGLSAEEIKERLILGADYVPALRRQSIYEARLNVAGALNDVAREPIVDLSVAEDAVMLAPGEYYVVRESFAPENVNDKAVSYVSGNPSVAAVDAFGVVTAKQSGTAEISVISQADSTKRASVSVTVQGEGEPVVFRDDAFRKAVVRTLASLPVRDEEEENPYASYTEDTPIFACDLYRIAVLYCMDAGIREMSEVAEFPSLRVLDCRENALVQLDVSALEHLHTLNCSENRLTSLDLRADGVWMSVQMQYNYLDLRAGSAADRLVEALEQRAQQLRYLPQLELSTAQDIALSCDRQQLLLREAVFVRADVFPDDAYERDIIWRSSDTSVLAVNEDGIVTARGAGSAVVTASLEGRPEIESQIDFTVMEQLSQPVTFADEAFGQTVLDALRRENLLTAEMTDSTPLYADDLCRLRSLTVNGEEVRRMDELDLLLGLTSFTMYNNPHVLFLDLNDLPLLEVVSVSGCGVKRVDVSGLRRLTWLSATGSKVSDLQLDGCNALKHLDVTGNNLYAMDLSGARWLNVLRCGGNNLTALDLTSLPYLETLVCSGNRLTRLDVSKQDFLTVLSCEKNRLLELVLHPSARYEQVFCQENHLDVSDGAAVRKDLDRAQSATYLPQNTLRDEAFSATPAYLHLEDGEMGAVCVPPSARNVIFETSDAAVATVDKWGVVRPVSSGYAQIRTYPADRPEAGCVCTVYVTDTAADGDGSTQNPFRLRDAHGLEFFSRFTTLTDNNTQSGQMRYLRASYRLEDDVNLSGATLAPAGYGIYNQGNSGFQGTFDGAGHTISNLRVNQTIKYNLTPLSFPEEGVGLFAYINGGTVKNLRLVAAEVAAEVAADTTQSKSSGYGILVGQAKSAEITRVSVEGRIRADTQLSRVGGMCGRAIDTRILDCASQADVSTGGVEGWPADGVGETELGGGYAPETAGAASGGLCGTAEGATEINNCAALGNVYGGESAGGFVGILSGGAAVRSCAAAGNVWGSENVGGMFGALAADAGNVTGCYAIGNLTGSSNRGGFAGNVAGGSLSGVFASGAVLGSGNGGSLVGTLESENVFADKAFFYAEQVLENISNEWGEAVDLSQMADVDFWSALSDAFLIESDEQQFYPAVKTSDGTDVLPWIQTPLGCQRTDICRQAEDVDAILSVGETADLAQYVKALPKSPLPRLYEWTAEDPAVITVDQSGIAAAHAFGIARVAVALQNNSDVGTALMLGVRAAEGEYGSDVLLCQTGEGAEVTVLESNRTAEASPLTVLAAVFRADGQLLRMVPCLVSAGESGDRLRTYAMPDGTLSGGAEKVILLQWESLRQMVPKNLVEEFSVSSAN